MIRDTLIKFLFLRLEATSSKTLSLLQQNWMKQIKSYPSKLRKFWCFSKKVSSNLLDLTQVNSFIMIITKELDLSYNCVSLSHLRKHKFKHFPKCLNLICRCGLDMKSTLNFLLLLQDHVFHDEKYILLNTWNKTDCRILELTNSSLSQILLYGSTLFDKEKNTHS